MLAKIKLKPYIVVTGKDVLIFEKFCTDAEMQLSLTVTRD